MINVKAEKKSAAEDVDMDMQARGVDRYIFEEALAIVGAMYLECEAIAPGLGKALLGCANDHLPVWDAEKPKFETATEEAPNGYVN